MDINTTTPHLWSNVGLSCLFLKTQLILTTMSAHFITGYIVVKNIREKTYDLQWINVAPIAPSFSFYLCILSLNLY